MQVLRFYQRGQARLGSVPALARVERPESYAAFPISKTSDLLRLRVRGVVALAG